MGVGQLDTKKSLQKKAHKTAATGLGPCLPPGPVGSDPRAAENHFLPTSVSWKRQMNPTSPHPARLAAPPQHN